MGRKSNRVVPEEVFRAQSTIVSEPAFGISVDGLLHLDIQADEFVTAATLQTAIERFSSSEKGSYFDFLKSNPKKYLFGVATHRVSIHFISLQFSQFCGALARATVHEEGNETTSTPSFFFIDELADLMLSTGSGNQLPQGTVVFFDKWPIPSCFSSKACFLSVLTAVQQQSKLTVAYTKDIKDHLDSTFGTLAKYGGATSFTDIVKFLNNTTSNTTCDSPIKLATNLSSEDEELFLQACKLLSQCYQKPSFVQETPSDDVADETATTKDWEMVFSTIKQSISCIAYACGSREVLRRRGQPKEERISTRDLMPQGMHGISLCPFQKAVAANYIGLVVFFVEHCGKRLDVIGASGASLLHLAAFNGCTETLKFLLDNHSANSGGPLQVDALEEAKWTPLHLACFQNHVECVKLLMEFGADPMHRQDDGSNCVMICVKFGYIECFQYIISTLNPTNDELYVIGTSTDCFLRNALSLACDATHEHAASMLRTLLQGVPVDDMGPLLCFIKFPYQSLRSIEGEVEPKAVHRITSSEKLHELVAEKLDIFHEAGIDWNSAVFQMCGNISFALHLIKNGLLEWVQFLMESKGVKFGNYNATSGIHWVHIAMEHCQFEIAHYILHYKTSQAEQQDIMNRTITNCNEAETVAHLLARKSPTKEVDSIDSYYAKLWVELLAVSPKCLTQKDHQKFTPLDYVQGNNELIRFLKDARSGKVPITWC